MFLKKSIITLMAFIAAAKGDEVWNGLTARFSPNITDGFFSLPQTLEAAKNAGWSEILGLDSSGSIKALGLHGDPRLTVLYSKETTKAIGVQIGFPTKDVDGTGQPMDYANLDAFITRTLNGESYYTVTLYFEIDELTGTRKLWFEEKTGLVEIPTSTFELISKTVFLKKRCVEGMGMHYNEMNPETDCTTMYPWFLVANGENVIGAGLQSFGSPSSGFNQVLWEATAENLSYYSVPESPACAVTAIISYGICVLHVWFISDPQDLVCG